MRSIALPEAQKMGIESQGGQWGKGIIVDAGHNKPVNAGVGRGQILWRIIMERSGNPGSTERLFHHHPSMEKKRLGRILKEVKKGNWGITVPRIESLWRYRKGEHWCKWLRGHVCRDRSPTNETGVGLEKMKRRACGCLLNSPKLVKRRGQVRAKREGKEYDICGAAC